ncbi:MAG: hypothetical protein IPJ52_10045 [Rhodocyclaceae bacterium]|nr:hypothetical protein [Rhodocyclaceae bacterium]
MMRKLAICAALAIGLPALAQQSKVSGGDTPPANPPQTQAAPADQASATPTPAASRGATARQALKALRGGDPPAKPKTPPTPADKTPANK